MKFIVYKKGSGELIGMYAKEGSARAQVTKHNKKLMLALLGNTLKPYQLEQEEEWSSCTWAEYESIFFQWYAISNRFGYRGYL
jgi:hypothetical protein